MPDPLDDILAGAKAMAKAEEEAELLDTVAAGEEIAVPSAPTPTPKPPRAPKPKLSIVGPSGSNAPPSDPPVPVPPAFSEDAIAARLVVQHGLDWRYAPKRGLWLRWDGAHWQEEELPTMWDQAKHLCREVVNFEQGALLSESAKRSLCSNRVHNAVVSIASRDKALTTREEQWDTDPMALATPAGVVDLTTGELRPSRREDYLSQITSVAPAAHYDCPRWQAFLEQVTAGDTELQDYLQRLVGYGMTGLTTEQIFAFFYGTGANGKGVFIRTIEAILKDHCKSADIATFTESQNERHTTEIARLCKARLVFTQETEGSKRLSESKIKTMTGGDKLTARFMRQDDFEFQPKFKIIMAGNHKPGLQDVGEAMRRRVHIVPWAVTIPIDLRDGLLEEKLRAEHPGILRWMIDGCIEWQMGGLRPPQSVLAATDEYMEAEDVLRGWMEECCLVEAGASAATGALYSNYVDYCERSKEHAWSKKRLLQNLYARDGMKAEREYGIRVVTGIGLKD